MSPKEGTLPLFPLPQIVILPGTVMPLHFFEPRYLQMVEDLLKEPRPQSFVMARLLAKDDMDYYLNPAFVRVGCEVGILQHRQNDNGTHDVMVVGTRRVLLDEGEGNDRLLYRTVSVTPLPYPEDHPEINAWLLENIEVCGQKLNRLQAMRDLSERLENGTLSARHVLNIITQFTVSDPGVLQDLLESDNPERQWGLVKAWAQN